MQNNTDDMQKYIDASTILSEARIMQEDYHETYILIEGKSDKTFFTTLVGLPTNIRFRPVNGWERVHNTILQAQKEGYTKILGIIDRDYHSLIQDGVTENNQLLFTDYNDIEMMLFHSQSFDKFLIVCADENKLKALDDPRMPILSAASYIGALRAISLANHFNFHFDKFECKDFVNRNTLSVDCKQLIEKITQRTRSKGIQVTISNEELETQVKSFIKEHNIGVLCNGHDVLDILSIAMVKLYASYSANQYAPDALFDYLLMGYSTEEFQKSELYIKLIDWIRTNVATA